MDYNVYKTELLSKGEAPVSSAIRMNISVVIPVFNEAHKISSDIITCSDWLKDNHPDSEIIIVDDGSCDNTLSVLERFRDYSEQTVKLITIPENRGKGYAVKQGILAASGEIILFADSGNCIPWSDIEYGISLVGDGMTDISHGSRYLPGSSILVKRSLSRRFISFCFRKLIRAAAGTPSSLSDTQCGLKIYRREAAKVLYSVCFTERFMFDVEIILRAMAAGYRITEFPVNWTPDRDSRLKILPTLLSTLREIRILKRKL